MKKKREVKKSVTGPEAKDPGEFKDLLPPDPESAKSPSGILESPRRKKRRRGAESLAPFVDEKSLGFIWRNIFQVIARASNDTKWELREDEESQLAEGTNKVLSKHLPAWLEDYMEEFSFSITLSFIFLGRLQMPVSSLPMPSTEMTKADLSPDQKSG